MTTIEIASGVFVAPTTVVVTGPDSAVVTHAGGDEYAVSGPEVAELLAALRKTSVTPTVCVRVADHEEIAARANDEIPW